MSPLNNVNPLSRKKESPKSVYFKIHRSHNREVLALCDDSLLGQVIFNEKAQMKVSTNFYRGQKIATEEALQLMRNYVNINALGSTIELGIKFEVIKKEAVIWFTTSDGKKIPYLLLFSLPPL